MTEDHAGVRFAVCVNMVRGVNRPCCGGRGSLDLLALVEKGIRERNLNVDVEKIVCLNKCLVGPNMRVVGGEIFSEVGETDVPKILDRLQSLAGFRPCGELQEDEKIIFPGS